MLLTKQELEKYLALQDDNKEFYVYEAPLSKKNRTKAQNNTFYLCFKKIGDKMGISSEEVKMNCLKAVFGITKSKFGGVEYENAIKPKTSDLSIEEARLFIEALVEFGRKLGLGEIVQSKEIQNLFYN